MHVITQKQIREAQERWPAVSDALQGWLQIMRKASPKNMAELKVFFPSVDKVGGVCVFNIGGHRLRLISAVRFNAQRVYIRSIMDHKEYDKGKWKNEI